MDIVIKISEGLKDVFENRTVTALDIEEMRMAIKNGTPLPKGHDRLIEAKRLKEVFCRNTGYDYHDLIDIAPTIIEADKESENK